MSKRISSALLALVVLATGFCLTSEANARTRSAPVQLAKVYHHKPRVAHARVAGGAGSTSLSCLTAPARALFGRIEARFGAMRVASTCRPGATVRDTGRPSRHASGNAIDFFADGRKGAVVAWLVANHTLGGTMTYSNSDHIHVDIGPRWVSLAGAYAFAGNRHGARHKRAG